LETLQQKSLDNYKQMTHTRIEVFQILEKTKVVPLYYHPDSEVLKKVVLACYKGGVRAFEFTSRGDYAFHVFESLQKFCVTDCPEMVLGAGSITDAAAASLYMQMGASFIVTPSLREDIALVCNRRKVLWSPGCGSLTEINRAEELGCELIKLFPGSVYGPDFVKAVKAPQPWTKIMPTGGVTTEAYNLKSWFKAGVSCVGIGGNLFEESLIKSENFLLLEQKVEALMTTVRAL